LAKWLSIVVLNVLGVGMLILFLGIRLNISPSYPMGLYKEVKGQWGRHDLVLSCLPKDVATMGIDRGYLGLSSQCNGHTPVIKKVIALAGDTVEIASQMRVNGEVIPNTPVNSADYLGRPLPRADGGTTPDGYVWLLSNHIENSFDSRYYGTIPTSLVQFKLEPLWTL